MNGVMMTGKPTSNNQDERRGGQDEGAAETTVALAGDGGCIAEARRLTADFLTPPGDGGGGGVPARTVGLIQVVVSELVTNARKYAPGPILLRLRLTGAAVEVAVWDSDPVLPTVREADPQRVGHHGLEIVKAIAQTLTMRPARVGKRITALISLRPGPQAAAPC
ncbi:ATP-binding protein [Streptomyces ziwulingensis]|uniref:ATP-binding protein n=1 Tax=Streptomyces ziwulingensis TaxID=1045501 RepID=A0ABP9C1H8_9ACTN